MKVFYSSQIIITMSLLQLLVPA